MFAVATAATARVDRLLPTAPASLLLSPLSSSPSTAVVVVTAGVSPHCRLARLPRQQRRSPLNSLLPCRQQEHCRQTSEATQHADDAIFFSSACCRRYLGRRNALSRGCHHARARRPTSSPPFVTVDSSLALSSSSSSSSSSYASSTFPSPLSQLSAHSVSPPPDPHIFVNLTNGLEALRFVPASVPVSFCRIQSTWCETPVQFDGILADLDHNLLLHLALGHEVLLFDFGSRNAKRGVPRAIWYGVEWIRFALYREWHLGDSTPDGDTDGGTLDEHGARAATRGDAPDAWLRGIRVNDEFARRLKQLSSRTRKKLRYYRAVVDEVQRRRAADGAGTHRLSEVRLRGVYGVTEHDGDRATYIDTLLRYLRRARAADDGGGDSQATREAATCQRDLLLQLAWDRASMVVYCADMALDQLLEVWRERDAKSDGGDGGDGDGSADKANRDASGN